MDLFWMEDVGMWERKSLKFKVYNKWADACVAVLSGGTGLYVAGEEEVAYHITSLTKWTLSHFLTFPVPGEYTHPT